MSWWVSAKRTRSYPYVRVYDSLNFVGKKVTVIPILKDEGKRGDRDFLQWDTVSLMSLLGVYVIISYYKTAEKSLRNPEKITHQRFDIEQIKSELKKLVVYQSDALHWNLEQIDKIEAVGEKALKSYEMISERTGVEMHSRILAERRIKELMKNKERFMSVSRDLARKAQKRESITLQPKERIKGAKATLTIKNYLGGCYYFTCDEVELKKKQVYLIEAKNTREDKLPSLNDIKDGLLKMILFTNLEEVRINDKHYQSLAILKLTTSKRFDMSKLSESQKKVLNLLKKEAQLNRFRVIINKKRFV